MLNTAFIFFFFVTFEIYHCNIIMINQCLYYAQTTDGYKYYSSGSEVTPCTESVTY